MKQHSKPFQASKLVFWGVLCLLLTLWVQAVDHTFEERVQTTLANLQQILNETRSIQRADQQEHTYTDKYALVEFATLHTWQSLAYTLFPVVGLNLTNLWNQWDIQSNTPVELHFRGKVDSKLLSEQEVDIEGDAVKTTSSLGFSSTTRNIHKVTEYKWQVTQSFEVFVCLDGSSCQIDKEEDPNNNEAQRHVVTSRASSVTVTTTTKYAPARTRVQTLPPLDITWLVKRFDPDRKGFRFKIDRNMDTCKTPRRNQEVNQVLQYEQYLIHWLQDVTFFLDSLYLPPSDHQGGRPTLRNALSDPFSSSVWNAAVPLFENATVLTADRVELLHQKEAQEVASRLEEAKEVFPLATGADVVVSFAEASLYVFAKHVHHLLWMHQQSIEFVEEMLRNQLIQAIGKEIGPPEFRQYMKFHANKFLDDNVAPQPFSVVVRHKDSAPVGSFAIEEQTEHGYEPVQLLTRRLSGQQAPLQIPIDAATHVELTGDRILSGWIQYQFETYIEPPTTQMTARARQFSSFVLLIGVVTGPNSFEPKSGIILKNKDEVLIPLLTESLPSAKEFKDAISSLSPEQQEFARAFRSMQLESSVFGVAVVQLKPQLEKLLNLPSGSLAKEIQLTEDLTTLFVDHHIGSDLLSFDGDASMNTSSKVALVKEYVGSVNGIIQAIKDEAKEEERQKAKTRAYMRTSEVVDDTMVYASSASSFNERPSVRPSASPTGAPTTSPTMSTLNRGITRLSSSAGGSKFALYGNPDAYSASNIQSAQESSGDGEEVKTQSLDELLESLGEDDEGDFFGGDELGMDNEDGAPEGDDKLNEKRTAKEPVTEQGADDGSSSAPSLDFTKIPKRLDAKLEQHDTEGYLRSMTIKADPDHWTLKRKANMLVEAVASSLESNDIRTERHKAFDLLDAISRSGSLPIDSSEFHVVIGVSHYFVNSLMKTLYVDNINPIAKAEKSLILLGSEILGKAPNELVRSAADFDRLRSSFPDLVATE